MAHQPQGERAMHQLAKVKRMQNPVSQSQAQMLQLWRKRSWCSEMQSHTKALGLHCLTSLKYESRRFIRLALLPPSRTLPVTSDRGLMLESHRYLTHLFQITNHPFSSWLMSLKRLSRQNLLKEDTWGHSLDHRWRWSWALSRPPLSVSFPNLISLGSSELFRTCPTHTHLMLLAHLNLLTVPLTPGYTHAPGGHLTVFFFSSLDCQKGLRLQYMMLKKLTRLFLFCLNSGLGWWSNSDSLTHLPLIQWTVLGWDQAVGAMEPSGMLVCRSSEHMALDQHPSGLMTMCFSASDESTCQATMQQEIAGQEKSRLVEVKSKKGVKSGTAGRRAQRGNMRSMMKTKEVPSSTNPRHHPDQRGIACIPMQCVTLMLSLRNWGFHGSQKRIYLLVMKCLTLVLSGILQTAVSVCQKTSAISIFKQLLSGIR